MLSESDWYMYLTGCGKEWDELVEVWFVLVSFKVGSGDGFVG